MQPPAVAATADRDARSAILGEEVAAPIGALARVVVLDGRFGVGRAASILPAHDHVASGAQLPDIAAQIEIGIFQTDRVADPQ